MNWLAMAGRIEYKEGVLRHIPTKVKAGPLANSVITIAKSDEYFENGTITFKVSLGGEKTLCNLMFNLGKDNGEFAAGIGEASNLGLYHIRAYKKDSWAMLSQSGIGDSLKPNQWYNTRVRVDGSRLELFVNDVKVCEASVPVAKTQLAFYFEGDSEIQVKDIKVEQLRPKAFVVMQFTDEYNQLYSEVIKPTCEHFKYDCIRADDMYNSGFILQDITNSIREASVVIADITPDNPNVFYEVGYAHGINKPTILLSNRSRVKLPFDVSAFRTLFYDNTIAGKTLVEDRLKKHLQAIGGT
jgi:hypothetical protein